MSASLSGDEQLSSSSSDDSGGEDHEITFDGNHDSAAATSQASLGPPPEPDDAEDAASESQIVVGPGPHLHDVLLGRGKPYQNFSGNRRMLKIVSKFKDQYNARPRDQKRPFVDTVLDEVLKDGTRFLRRVEDGDGWEEVDRASAAEKVWHALRSKGRSKKKARVAASVGGLAPLHVVHEGLVSGGAEELPQQHASFHQEANNVAAQPPPQTSLALTLPRIEALSREILMHLSHAAATTTLLARMTAAATHQQQMQQQQQQTTQQHASGVAASSPAPTNDPPTQAAAAFRAAAGLLNSELPHHSQLAPPPSNVQNLITSFPPNFPELGSPPLLPPGLYSGFFQQSGGGAPPAPALGPTPAPSQQAFNPSDRNQVLLQALGTLWQAAQQNNTRPPPPP